MQNLSRSRAASRVTAWRSTQRSRLKGEYGFSELPPAVEEELKRISRKREVMRQAVAEHKFAVTGEVSRANIQTPRHEIDHLHRLMKEAQAQRKAAATHITPAEREAHADMMTHALAAADGFVPWWSSRPSASTRFEASSSSRGHEPPPALSVVGAGSPEHQLAALDQAPTQSPPPVTRELTEEQKKIMHDIFGDSPPSSRP